MLGSEPQARKPAIPQGKLFVQRAWEGLGFLLHLQFLERLRQHFLARLLQRWPRYPNAKICRPLSGIWGGGLKIVDRFVGLKGKPFGNNTCWSTCPLTCSLGHSWIHGKQTETEPLGELQPTSKNEKLSHTCLLPCSCPYLSLHSIHPTTPLQDRDTPPRSQFLEQAKDSCRDQQVGVVSLVVGLNRKPR